MAQAGSGACRSLGWLVGLPLLLLPSHRRSALGARLAYYAALCAARRVLVLPAPLGAAALIQAPRVATACSAVLLGASTARLLQQYALAAAGQPSRLDARSVEVVHFLLGFEGLQSKSKGGGRGIGKAT